MSLISQMLGEACGICDDSTVSPVVDSFKSLSMARYDESNPTLGGFGLIAWEQQVDRASIDFKKRFKKLVDEISKNLDDGRYAPQSAVNMGERPLDRKDREAKEKKAATPLVTAPLSQVQ